MNGDVGEVMEWMWGKTREALWFEDGETADGQALLKQTAANVQASHEKLKSMAQKARLVELEGVAARLEGAAERLAGAAGLAEALGSVIKTGEQLTLIKRLSDTTAAVLAVDMQNPEAAATFDAWFAAMGETGELLADVAGPWGPILKPFATFIRLLGECNFFVRVRDNMQMHGSRSANGAALKELAEEGF